MAEIRARCQCGQTLKISEKHAGKKAKCPKCGIALVVPTPEALIPLLDEEDDTTRDTGGHESDVPRPHRGRDGGATGTTRDVDLPPEGILDSCGSIRFACSCGKHVRASVEKIGERVGCPRCGKALVVPPGQRAAQTDEEPEPGEPEVGEAGGNRHGIPSVASTHEQNLCEGREHERVTDSSDEPISHKGGEVQAQVLVKTYHGTQEQATALFRSDAEKMAAQGYFPTAQTWAPTPRPYGCAAFFIAAILWFVGFWYLGCTASTWTAWLIALVLGGVVPGVLAGILVILGEVRGPAGTLSVTYELHPVQTQVPTLAELPSEVKTCPQSAEQVKAAAHERVTDSSDEPISHKGGEVQAQVLVKTYHGTQEQATALFRSDAEKMAAQGYFPTAQTWAPGSYGCAAFLIALLLCLLLIGILVFIYMLIVKPPGTLSVTYELRPVQTQVPTLAALPSEVKTCPQCAEQVKAAAKVCRFCHHKF